MINKLAEFGNTINPIIFHTAYLSHKGSSNKIQFHNKNNFMNRKVVLFLSVLLMAAGTLKAQIINEGFEEPIWTNFGTGPGASTYGSVVLANVPANSTMSYLTLGGASNYTTALNTCNNSGTWYYSKATSQSSTKFGQGAHSISHSVKIGQGGYIITPLTPAAVVNITFWAANSSGVMLAGLATDPNSNVPGYNTSTSNVPGAFSYATSSYATGTNTMQSYSFGCTFSGPCRFGIFNPGGTIYIDDIMVYAPTGTPPTISTGTATPAITSASVNGTVTPGTLPLLATGIIWSTTNNFTGTVADTLNPKTRDIPAATAGYTDQAAPLNPGTTYYYEAYVIGLDGSLYFGTVSQFTTQSLSVPVVTTTPASAVFSNKATVGGVVTDSGGLHIKTEVIKYGISKAALTSSASPVPNPSLTTSFSVRLTLLTPSTKYYYQACATNALGTSCGNIDSFTTGAAVPTIAAIPNTLSFGDIIYNNPSPILSYTLTGDYFPASGGNVAVNLSTTKAYILSFSPSSFTGTPGNSLNISFSGVKFKKTVYVKFLTSNYGAFPAVITHTNASVAPQDADTVKISGNIVTAPYELSNVGNDFWTGFAYLNQMKEATSQFDTFPKGVPQTPAKGAHLSLFLAGGSQGDSVTVELPGIPNAVSFPRTVYVPANGFVEVGGFPVGDSTDAKNASGKPDARLYFTGVTKRGIHLFSKSGVPFSSWLYDWQTGDGAAGAMLFPTNTWNSSYVVQAVGGKANSSSYNNNSFFFVIAKDDNTVVTFKPTNDILDNNASTIFTNGHLHNSTYVKYQKDSTYSILLNKGEIFNAMGFVGDPAPTTADPGALDLSGTVVSTTCDKKIAVFGGNGRCVLGYSGSKTITSSNKAAKICLAPESGSDNLVQQMFPKVAWSTNYLTVPTKNMADNLFRVYIQDTTTNVKVNNILLPKANLVNGLYYQFDYDAPAKIEGDKPISVTQFIVSGDCGQASSPKYPTPGNIGAGDPEMITLSPIQQSIKNATVYSATFKNGNKVPGNGASYINVVVKGIAGVNSFKLDGLQSGIDTGTNTFTGALYGHSLPLTMAKAFRQHPQDPNYYYATFWVNPLAKHTLSSSEGFNAVAYGVSDGESYGYNAGTSIKNLSKPPVFCNPFGPCIIDSVGSGVVTCKNNWVTIKVASPYLLSMVDSVVWNSPPNAYVHPNDTTFTGPTMVDPSNPANHYATPSDTIVVGNQKFYVYTCPIQFSFSEYGSYPIYATFHGKFASDCPGIDQQTIYVKVSSDNIDFRAIPAGCGSTLVTFKDSSIAMPGTYITKWEWNLGDTLNKFYTGPDSTNRITFGNPHNYPGLNPYWAKLKTYNSVGCSSEDSVYIDLAFGITAKFVKDNNDTICPKTTINFTDSSSANAASWKWDFGESGSTSTSQSPSHTYTTPGMHIISLQVFTSGNCPSKLFYDTIYVSELPKPNFTFGGVCLPGSTIFTNTSDTATGFVPYTHGWYFGDGTPRTSTKDGLHTYTSVPTGGYPVTLIETNRFGCVDSITKQVATIYAKPTADFTVVKSDICLGDKANFTDNNNSTATNQTINQWHWFFGDGKDTVTVVNTAPHLYGSIGTDSVKLVIQTDKGCVSDTSVAHAIKVHVLPVPSFVLPGSCLGSGPVTFTNTSTISSGETLTSVWSFDDVKNPPNTSTATDGVHDFKDTGNYSIIIVTTSTFGCTASDTAKFNVAGSQPVPSFTIANAAGLCSNVPVTITDNSTIKVGIIKKVEIYWNYTGASTVPDTTDNNPSKGINGSTKAYTHVYPVSTFDQTFNVRLVAYSGTTCFHDTTISITVHGVPIPSFVMPGSCLGSGSVTFMDKTTANSGIPLSSVWTFGDPVNPPNTSNATNGVHTFKDTGTYTIIQTVTSTFGCSAADTGKLNIAGSEPRPYFYIKPNSICSNLPITLTDTSRVDVGVIKKVEIYWNWTPGMSVPDVTDNSPSNGKVNNVKSYGHSYPALGADKIYAIRLVAYSGSTCFHDTVINITVHGSPNVFFGALSDICLNASPLTLTATDLNSLPGAFTYLGPTGTISGNTFDPSKLLPYTPGTYNIKAVYTTTAGCVDTTPANPIRVLGLPKAYPLASYPLCEKRAINFTDTSNAMGGTIVTRTWVIDGNVFSGSPQTYYYSGAVNDVVKLIVTTSIGCNSDTAKLPLIINPLPHVDFNIQSSTCLPKGTTQMTDLTTLPGTAQPSFSWLWNFGDIVNNQSAVQNPSHDYTSAANYNITLKVTSTAGCDSSLTKTLLSTQIHPAPVASYTVTPAKAQVCLGDSILFTDNSAGTVVKSIWYYGDGSRVDTAFSVHHAYDAASTYTATHAIIDNNGCISVTSVPTSTRVTIDALPIVNAGYDKYVVIGDSVVLNEVSVIANNFTSWWSTYPYNLYLNDTTLLNPVFAPTVAGNYNYMLTVKTQAGCIGTSSINLIALDPPIIPNTFSPNGDGIHDLWEIGFLNKYPGATVKVFNRYGQLIYNVLGYFKPWDGTVNGAPLPIGTYYYIISPRNGLKDIIGTITIIR